MSKKVFNITVDLDLNMISLLLSYFWILYCLYCLPCHVPIFYEYGSRKKLRPCLVKKMQKNGFIEKHTTMP